jgi:ribosomal protein S8
LISQNQINAYPLPFTDLSSRRAYTVSIQYELTKFPSLGYIGEFEIVDDHRSGKIVVQLNGRLNKAGVISPRYNVQVSQIENWVNLLLPARQFGIIIFVR